MGITRTGILGKNSGFQKADIRTPRFYEARFLGALKEFRKCHHAVGGKEGRIVQRA